MEKEYLTGLCGQYKPRIVNNADAQSSTIATSTNLLTMIY